MNLAAQSAPPGRQAGIAVRLLASAYEAVLTAALAMALGFLLLPWVSAQGIPSPASRIALPGLGARALSFGCLLVAFGAYYTWLWSGGRGTLPMRTWRVELVTRKGISLGPRHAALRYAAWWIGPLCAVGAYVGLRSSGHGRWAVALLSLNYAWALIDRDRQFLHDRLAATRMVRKPARDRSPDPTRSQDF